MDDFGVDLTITPPGGGAPVMVDDGQGGQRLPRGILENGHHEAEAAGIDVASTNPQVIVPSHETGGAEKGWGLEANGTTYEIHTSKPDGTGMHVFDLHLND